MGMAMLSKSLTQFDSYMFYMIQLIPGFIMVVLVSQANCDGLLPSTLCTSIVQAENVRFRVRAHAAEDLHFGQVPYHNSLTSLLQSPHLYTIYIPHLCIYT